MRTRDIEIMETSVRAIAGGEIGKCITQAAMLCLERGETVRLTHNGKIYTADPKVISNLIYRSVDIKPETPMSTPKPNKRVTPRAASFKRIAKALRVRARNHAKAARGFRKAGMTFFDASETTRADIYTGIASELDNEARTLRAQR